MITFATILAMCIGGAFAMLGGFIHGILRGNLYRFIRLVAILESIVLAVIGGATACLFVFLLLLLAGPGSGGKIIVGWAFFLWPGLIDSVLHLAGYAPIFGRRELLCLAVLVGAFHGATNGLASVNSWRRGGPFGFLLDVSWGLCGTTNAALLHLANFGWAARGEETRAGAFRYVGGFRFKSGFAVTIGSVMSNMGDHEPGSELFAHELTHVWQNRIFGPFYPLTYLGWMVIFAIPGMIAGLVCGVGAFFGAEQWAYFNNPWEAWAYRVGAGPREGRSVLIWSDSFVAWISVPFFLATLAGASWLLWNYY